MNGKQIFALVLFLVLLLGTITFVIMSMPEQTVNPQAYKMCMGNCDCMNVTMCAQTCSEKEMTEPCMNLSVLK